MAADLNVVALTGRLTKDPELMHTQSGSAVAKLRLAWNTRGKDGSGEWVDRGNFIDVDVWGNQGEAVAQHLSKGRRIAVQGSLQWREWEASDGSGKRQAISVTAYSVIYLDYKDDDGGTRSDDFQPAGVGSDSFGTPGASKTDDDIPF